MAKYGKFKISKKKREEGVGVTVAVMCMHMYDNVLDPTGW